MKQKNIENKHSSIFNLNSQKIKKSVMYGVWFIILTAIYYYFSSQLPLNSDQASILLEAKDILNGNIFLDGWYLSTVPFYFTETLPLTLLSLLLDNKLFLLHLMPALYYALIILVTYSIIKTKKNSCAAFIGLILIPSPFFAINSITACVHVGAIVVALIILKSYTRNSSTIENLLLSVFGGLALYSDGILLYFLIIPIFIAVITSFLIHRATSILAHAVIPIGSIVFSKLIRLFFEEIDSFINPGTTPPRFATIEQFCFNLKIMIEAFLKLFGADILGGSIEDTKTRLALYNLLVVIFLLSITIKKIKKNHNFEFVDYILMSSSSVIPAAFLFSNIPVDVSSGRYLIPSIIAFVIFIGRNMVVSQTKYTLITISLFVFCTINFQNIIKFKKHNTPCLIAQYLKENNLGDGFANYWKASSVSVIMNDRNTVIVPVNVSTTDDKIYAYKWLSNSKWFNFKSQYIILDNDEQLKSLIKIFGDDAKIKKIDDAYIIVYKDKRLTLVE